MIRSDPDSSHTPPNTSRYDGSGIGRAWRAHHFASTRGCRVVPARCRHGRTKCWSAIRAQSPDVPHDIRTCLQPAERLTLILRVPQGLSSCCLSGRRGACTGSGKSVANLECIVCGEFQARNAKASGRAVWFGMDDDDNGSSPRGASVEVSMSDTAANGAPRFRIAKISSPRPSVPRSTISRTPMWKR